MIFLLDTNTFSYIAKGSSPAARQEFQRHEEDRESRLCLSVITEAEVRFGMAKHSLSASRKAAIEGLLAHFEILPWGSAEAAVYAEERARLEAQGITLATMNLLIAAQAIAAGATLVSNDSIFRKTKGLWTIENWTMDVF
jgi:tRNA(fMet)-specific endonuclease VapC